MSQKKFGTSQVRGGTNIDRDIDRVREFFDNNRYGQYTADDVYEQTGVKYETARRYCNRLVKTKFLRKEKKGHFRFNDDLTMDEVNNELKELPTTLHSLLIIGERKNGTKREGGPIFGTYIPKNPKKVENKGDEIQLGFTLDHFMAIPINVSNMRTIKKEWKDRKLTIQIEKTSALKIIINLGMSREPIDVFDLLSFYHFLRGMFEPIFQEYNWKISGYAIAKDSDTLWIRGAEEIALQSIEGYVQRWYNKKETGKCRRETHCKVNLPVPTEEAIKNLFGELPLGATSLIKKTDKVGLAIDQLNNQYREARVKINVLTDEIVQLRESINRLCEQIGTKVDKSLTFPFRD